MLRRCKTCGTLQRASGSFQLRDGSCLLWSPFFTASSRGCAGDPQSLPPVRGEHVPILSQFSAPAVGTALAAEVLGSCCSPGNAPFYAGPELVCYTRVGVLPEKRHRGAWGLHAGKVPQRHGWLPYRHLKGSLSRSLCWVLPSEETYQRGAFVFPNPDPGWQLELKLVVPQD